MQKIGIITLYGLENYGNRLQNYAVQEVLNCMGYRTKTFFYTNANYNLGKKSFFKWAINTITNYKFCPNADRAKIRSRIFSFKKFNNQFICTEKIYSLKNLSKKADFFIVGSDQVWNPTWYQGWDHQLYLLSFAEPKKRVSLSPSFGIFDLPQEWKKTFQKQLKEFYSLSVREESGARIIKELTGKDVTVLIDPTLMLEPEQWLKIAKRPRNVGFKKPYILTYFLGKVPEDAVQLMKKIKLEDDYNIYEMNQTKYPDLYCCGPSEFIYLFSRASLVLTDSFHACIFSFLFNKPFFVYNRSDHNLDMSSRLDTLLSTLNISQKVAGNSIGNDLFECDYSIGKSRLKELRENVLFYLKNALEGER